MTAMQPIQKSYGLPTKTRCKQITCYAPITNKTDTEKVDMRKDNSDTHFVKSLDL